jgi:hypothetical protein
MTSHVVEPDASPEASLQAATGISGPVVVSTPTENLLEDLAPMEGNSVSGTFVAQPHPLVDVLHARHEAAPDRSGSPPSRCHVEGPECTGAGSQ